MNREIIDEVAQVSDSDAYDMSKALSREEGMAAGISAGAAVCAALRVARRMGPEENVVVVIPDGWERYYSLEQQFH